MLRIPRFLLLFILLAFSFTSQAGRKLKVLFIGNSYTYVNNLPQLIASIASSVGDTLVYDSYTIGGYRFADHAFDTLCAQKIRSGHWDMVVLQEQSQTPAMQTGYFFTNSYHYAYVLDTMIEHSDPCTEKMFYMTWGRKNGDTGLCAAYPTWPAFCTYESMDSLIRLRYRAYADTALPPVLGYPLVPGSWFSPIRLSQLSPVGAVWHYLRQQFPGMELYQADESHPSEAGSFAAASTFYAALFRRDPSASTFNYTLSASDANNIRQTVKLHVFDSLHIWNIGLHDLRAQFRYQFIGGNQVLFINISSGTLDFQWDLGDGTTTTSGTLFHTYPGPGVYTVRLIATNGGCSDTMYGVVNLMPAGIGQPGMDEGAFVVSPNPAGNFIQVQAPPPSTVYDLAITDAGGRRVYAGRSLRGNRIIDISDLPAGVYLLRFGRDGKGACYRKLVKE